MNPPVVKLEFSIDPLSDTTPAWTNITPYLQSASWQSGVSGEFDDPQAGSATFVLKNTNRRFEPEYAAGAYYPNIVPGRRFRLTIDGTQQGIWYATSWQVEYPAGTTYSTVTVTCADGFWRLSQDALPTMVPRDATTYAEVVKVDNPFAYYALNEQTGRDFKGDPGPQGKIYGRYDRIRDNPIAGNAEKAVQLPVFITSGFGRATLPNVDTFADIGTFSIEAVTWQAHGSGFESMVAGGPFVASRTSYQFMLNTGRATFELNTGASTTTIQLLSAAVAGYHHLCATFDGNTFAYYRDGALVASTTVSGIIQPASDSFLYIADKDGVGLSEDVTISGVAFYTYALSAQRVQEHADAALNRGYRAQTSGVRIAALATDPLWSTAGMSAGTITAAPRYQTGQPTLEEITTTMKIENPGSLFYFDDAGNPDYRALQDTQTVAATFGELEIRYDDLQFVYNDELWNTSTISGDLINGTTTTNTQSTSDYGVRAQDATDLIITSEADAAFLSQTIIDYFSTPGYRLDSISLNGSQPSARTQILTREVGDTIHIRRRGEGGTPIDIVTRILSKSKSIDTNGDLRCVWTLARGFNVATPFWHLGVAGYDELNTAAVLG